MTALLPVVIELMRSVEAGRWALRPEEVPVVKRKGMLACDYLSHNILSRAYDVD